MWQEGSLIIHKEAFSIFILLLPYAILPYSIYLLKKEKFNVFCYDHVIICSVSTGKRCHTWRWRIWSQRDPSLDKVEVEESEWGTLATWSQEQGSPKDREGVVTKMWKERKSLWKEQWPLDDRHGPVWGILLGKVPGGCSLGAHSLPWAPPISCWGFPLSKSMEREQSHLWGPAVSLLGSTVWDRGVVKSMEDSQCIASLRCSISLITDFMSKGKCAILWWQWSQLYLVQRREVGLVDRGSANTSLTPHCISCLWFLEWLTPFSVALRPYLKMNVDTGKAAGMGQSIPKETENQRTPCPDPDYASEPGVCSWERTDNTLQAVSEGDRERQTSPSL